jgi:maltodextrin utilization protein YvdJ
MTLEAKRVFSMSTRVTQPLHKTPPKTRSGLFSVLASFVKSPGLLLGTPCNRVPHKAHLRLLGFDAFVVTLFRPLGVVLFLPFIFLKRS